MNPFVFAMIIEGVVLMVVTTAILSNSSNDLTVRGQRRAKINAIREEGNVSDQRAYSLFIALLTPRQRRQLHRKGLVVVHGGVTGWRYKIKYGSVGNITVCNPVPKQLCCHLFSNYDFPTFDHMVAQLLNIQHNEKFFLSTAFPRIFI